MDKLFVIPDLKLVKLLLDIVFHRFHIVIGGLFDLFYLIGIFKGEVPADQPQLFKDLPLAPSIRAGVFCKGR